MSPMVKGVIDKYPDILANDFFIKSEGSCRQCQVAGGKGKVFGHAELPRARLNYRSQHQIVRLFRSLRIAKPFSKNFIKLPRSTRQDSLLNFDSLAYFHRIRQHHSLYQRCYSFKKKRAARPQQATKYLLGVLMVLFKVQSTYPLSRPKSILRWQHILRFISSGRSSHTLHFSQNVI